MTSPTTPTPDWAAPELPPGRLRVYVSGPMTDLPGNNAAAFFAAELALQDRGFAVCNPARLRFGPDVWWIDAMPAAVRLMLRCRVVFMLDGFHVSPGCIKEMELAKALGLPVFTQAMLPKMVPALVAQVCVMARREAELAAASDRILLRHLARTLAGKPGTLGAMPLGDLLAGALGLDAGGTPAQAAAQVDAVAADGGGVGGSGGVGALVDGMAKIFDQVDLSTPLNKVAGSCGDGAAPPPAPLKTEDGQWIN